MAKFPLVPLRVKRWGNSYVVVLPQSFMDDLHVHEGDIIAVRIHAPYATFCVWPLNRLAPMQDVDVKALPPLNPQKVADAESD